jgi:hypothetical protein
VRAGQVRSGRGGRGQVGVDRRDGVPGEQQQGGVEDVLAGAADVDGDRVPFPDRVLQDPHQRRHRVAGVGRSRDDGGEVQPCRVGAGGGHRVGGRRRHQPGARRGAGQGGLHLEQRPEPGVVGDGRRCRTARERPGEQTRHGSLPTVTGQTAKKTVSWSPCRWMSKR